MGLGSLVSASVLECVVCVVTGGEWASATGDGKSIGPKCRGIGSRGLFVEEDRWCWRGVVCEKSEPLGLCNIAGDLGSLFSSRLELEVIQVAGYGSLSRWA